MDDASLPLDVFQVDPDFAANEEKYKTLKAGMPLNTQLYSNLHLTWTPLSLSLSLSLLLQRSWGRSPALVALRSQGNRRRKTAKVVCLLILLPSL